MCKTYVIELNNRMRLPGDNRSMRQKSVEEAFCDLEKYEAITENTARKYGKVSDALAHKLLFAEIDYAIAKDNRHDPCMQDD